MPSLHTNLCAARALAAGLSFMPVPSDRQADASLLSIDWVQLNTPANSRFLVLRGQRSRWAQVALGERSPAFHSRSRPTAILGQDGLLDRCQDHPVQQVDDLQEAMSLLIDSINQETGMLTLTTWDLFPVPHFGALCGGRPSSIPRL
jgi:hypothetical protein